MSNPFRKARGITDGKLAGALNNHQKSLQVLWVWALRRETTLRLQRIFNIVVILALILLAVWK